MEKLRLCALLWAALMLGGCSAGDNQDPQGETQWDKIPMAMVDGDLYYDTGKESTVAEGSETADGRITSTVDSSETPTENDQSNFGESFAYRRMADGTLEIFINEKWIVFERRTGTGSQVRFGDRWVARDGLSEETLDWLAWYNNLSEKERLAVSAVPSDLLEESGISGTEDAEAASN